jgi:hypothetical protein
MVKPPTQQLSMNHAELAYQLFLTAQYAICQLHFSGVYSVVFFEGCCSTCFMRGIDTFQQSISHHLAPVCSILMFGILNTAFGCPDRFRLYLIQPLRWHRTIQRNIMARHFGNITISRVCSGQAGSFGRFSFNGAGFRLFSLETY